MIPAGYRYAPEVVQAIKAKRSGQAQANQLAIESMNRGYDRRHGYRTPSLGDPPRVKKSLADLAAECGLLYIDGKVHIPPVPVQRKVAA